MKRKPGAPSIVDGLYALADDVVGKMLGFRPRSTVVVRPVPGFASGNRSVIGSTAALANDEVVYRTADGEARTFALAQTRVRSEGRFVVLELGPSNDAIALPFMQSQSEAMNFLDAIEQRKRAIADELERAAAAEKVRLEAEAAEERKRAEAVRIARERAAYEKRTQELNDEIGLIEKAFADALQDLNSCVGSYLRRRRFRKFIKDWAHLHDAFAKTDAALKERPNLRRPNGRAELESVLSDPKAFLQRHNDAWAQREVNRHSDTLKRKLNLDAEQADAAVRLERQVLVSAPAGSGKTRLLEGRAFHILETASARPDEILFVTFANKTRGDLRKRIRVHSQLHGSSISTFHALGRSILKKGGLLRHISPMAKDRDRLKAWVEAQLRSMLQEEDPHNPLRLFIERGLAPNPPSHNVTLDEYFDSVSSAQLKAIDGTKVRSVEELILANWFYMRGIEYKYEEPYFRKVKDIFSRRVYCPDFYVPGARLEDDDSREASRRGVWHEHLALDDYDRTPTWIDEERYVRGIQWKRREHAKNNTELFETRSADFSDGTIFAKLDDYYRDRVAYEYRPSSEIVAALGRRFSALPDLFVSFFENARAKSLELDDLKARVLPNDFRSHHFLQVYERLADAYWSQLQSSDTMDFDQMITEATEEVRSGRFTPPWRYIIVDEYQDVSENQIRFLGALNESARQLFCVGDRRQAIYGFRGAEAEAMTTFAARFRDVDTRRLRRTYRSNARIAGPANEFVTVDGEIEPLEAREATEPRIIVIGQKVKDEDVRGDDGSDDHDEDFDPSPLVARIIAKLSKEMRGSSVKVLARYTDHIPDHPFLKSDSLTVEALTIHRSKGLEATYAIITDAIEGFKGFPAQRPRDPLFRLLGTSDPMIEERNLMYVALTRAEQVAYVLTDWNAPSSFVQELLDLGARAVNAPAEMKVRIDCPRCESGRIVRRFGRFVCSHQPLCDAYFDTCPRTGCRGMMQVSADREMIECEKCDLRLQRCNSCIEGYVKTTATGNLLNCSRYRHTKKVFSCTFVAGYDKVDPTWLVWDSPSKSMTTPADLIAASNSARKDPA